MTPEAIANMPIAAAVLAATVYVMAWAALAIGGVISALWTVDQAAEFLLGSGGQQ